MIQQRIHQRKKDLQQLREAVESNKCSAQAAVEDSERIFTELVRSIKRSHSEMIRLIRDQENTAVSRAEGRLKQMEQEINDLRRRDAELEQLSHTQDHIHFLQMTRNLCVICLGEEHVHDVLEEAVCVHCELLPMKKLRSRLSLFSRKEGQPLAPCGSGPATAEARRKLSLWASQVDLANKLDKGLFLSRSSVGDESELLEDDDVISLTSSDPAASALLGFTQEEQELLDEEMQSESSQTFCPTYVELLEAMEGATARLDLPWKRVKKVAPRGRLYEHFLSDHKPPAQVSFPFLPDLYLEVVKAWNKPFSSCIHRFQHTSYANVEGMGKNGFERMPPIEETLASYLSLGEIASSLQAPSLPSDPLQ
ncbi:hypothetical protein M9458_053166 [Cirrhinus mrigala]|uniref:TRIM8/14/16/25/29/45/65 coiled-coil region domain-containing protein n=2 Tax=Cirrhinus mrigala TaxID=683832 RepID=A0ABD0MN53_CIRMR